MPLPNLTFLHDVRHGFKVKVSANLLDEVNFRKSEKAIVFLSELTVVISRFINHRSIRSDNAVVELFVAAIIEQIDSVSNYELPESVIVYHQKVIIYAVYVINSEENCN